MTKVPASSKAVPAPAAKVILDRYLPAAGAAQSAAAKALVARDHITVHSYTAVPFSTGGLWHSGNHHNRTWLFALHSFAPLDCLMSTGETDHAVALIEEWIRLHGIEPAGKMGVFPWHDHATALRLDRLSLLELSVCDGRFAEMAQTHADLLLRNDFYSKHTNHGYDQSLSLILAAFTFAAYTDTARWMQVGLERLTDEIDFAFNAEGVHVENSPAYHVGMTANLVRGRFLLSQINHDTNIDFDDVLNRALLFTAWAIGPDRKLAMLGDSTERGGTPPPELGDLPHYDNAIYACTGGAKGTPPETQFALYPDAGYGFYRSSWAAEGWKDHVYLAMKSGFLSKYHRQDDDLNVLLNGFSEAWLIDSGLYNHNQKDPKRLYMRSARAHNVPFIQDRSISRALPDAKKRPRIEALTGENGEISGFVGTTQMYNGVTVTRQVEVQSQDVFQIKDSFGKLPETEQKYCLFHVPADKTVRVSPHFARIVGARMELVIRIGSGQVRGCQVYRGSHPDFPSQMSRSINQIEDTQVIVFGPIHGNNVRFSLRFHDKSN